MSGIARDVASPQANRREKTLRWLAAALIAIIVIAAFVLPLINISRYHRTISETLARSIGHPVHLGAVKLQIFPRPGLAITDFVVDENPDFGAEPLLRSPSVTVSVRLTSLWRGRLEVSRIDLDDASVNLVRDAAGQWNFASLLEQASRIPNAATAQRHAGATPRFPYIQFKSARINFKFGNEKKGFAFLNSDLSIWLDNPQQWRLRFEGQPARTDLDLELEDTGLMRLEGSLDRASSLDRMPVRLHAEWNKAELGQVSRMIFAEDTGWRGDLRAQADLAGPIGDLQLTTRLRVADVHRVEFFPLTPFNVDTRCRAEFRHSRQALDNLTCLWPVENGHLLLTGNVRNLAAPQSQLTLEINQTPASFFVNMLGLLRATLPSSLNAAGLINGSFNYATDTVPKLRGQAEVAPLTVALADSVPFVLPAVHFSAQSVAVAPVAGRRKRPPVATQAPAAGPEAIILESSALNMGAPNPLQISGQFTLSGFSLRLTGEAGVGRLRDLSSSFAALRTSTAHLAPQGVADMDLTFAGPWLAEPVASVEGLSPSNAAMQGWLRIQNARAMVDWLPGPVEITSASAAFGDGRIRWSNANLTVNDVAIHGSGDAPLRCDRATPCPIHFNLDIPELDVAALQSALLGAGRHGELLEKILAEVQRKTAPWPEMDGQAHVGALTLGGLALQDVRSSISVEDHRLQITSLDAAALGGSVHATGTVEASGSQPQYSLEADWSGVDVSKVAALFSEEWPASGVMDGGTHLALQGYSKADLEASAQGTFHWLWRSGSLLAASAAGSGRVLTPTHFSQWSASGSVANATLTLNKTGPANPVSGTISFDGKLDLMWSGAAAAAPIHIGGTLAHPATDSAERAANR